MSKLAPYLSDIHATLIGMYSRQQLYVERMAQYKAQAAETAKAYGISEKDAMSKMKAAQEEEAAARADLAALHEELKERIERLLVKNEEMTKDWPNASSAALQNLFKVIELSGEHMVKTQVAATAGEFKGDYISLRAIAEAYRKVNNAAAVSVVENLIPDVPALMKRMLERSEMIKTIKYGVDQIARPYYELCEALGDTYKLGEFDNPFQFEMWMKQAGM